MGLLTAAIIVGLGYVTCRLYNKYKEKQREVEALEGSLGQWSSTYALEPADTKLVNDCSSCLNNYLGNSTFEEKLRGRTLEEKKTAAVEIAEKLARTMDVEVASIEVRPDSEMGGSYGMELCDATGKISIALNELQLEADPDRFLFTILHELRHAVQDSSIRNNKWGFSDERVAQWLYSNQNYVQARCRADFKAYQNQIVELDANTFADAVIRKLNK